MSITLIGYTDHPAYFHKALAIPLPGGESDVLIDERLKFCTHVVSWENNIPVSWAVWAHSTSTRSSFWMEASPGEFEDFKHLVKEERLTPKSYDVWAMPGINAIHYIPYEDISLALSAYRNEKFGQRARKAVADAYASGNPNIRRSKSGKNFVINTTLKVTPIKINYRAWKCTG